MLTQNNSTIPIRSREAQINHVARQESLIGRRAYGLQIYSPMILHRESLAAS